MAAKAVTRITESLFAQVAQHAAASPRRRKNHNLHHESDLVQRFLNVLQPGTYVRPHRHRREQARAGFECFVVLQGSVGLLVLNSAGEVLQRERLEAGGEVRGVQLAEGLFHTLVALEADSVMFEIKQGPYEPLADKDFLASFPLEGTLEAIEQERLWRSLFNGEHGDETGPTPGQSKSPHTSAPSE